MELDKRFLVLKTLDNMPRFIFWPIDEFIILIIAFFLGLCMSSLLIMLSGLIPWFYYKKLKKKNKQGSFIHKMYWNLPTKPFKKLRLMKNVPESHLRDLVL
jgi:type IV conjugative transfer system protein TraL